MPVSRFLTILAVLAAVLVPAAAFAQDGPSAKYTTPELLPAKLKGEVFDHTLTIKNDGTETLTISRVSPKCPCARITDFPKSIEPGQTGEVKMTIDSGRIALGRHEKKINIFTNAFPQRQAYWFRIEVRPAFTLVPELPVVSGLYNGKKVGEVLVSKASEEIEILAATSKNGSFKVDSVTEVVKGTQYRLNLSAPAVPAPTKSVDELILKVRTRSGREITTEVGVKIHHQTAIVLEPNGRIFWGNKETDTLLVDGAKPLEKKIAIRSIDPSVKFKVKSATLEGKGTEVFETKIETKTEGNSYVVRVILKEYSKETYLKAKLVIVTDDADAPSRKIEVMAMFGKRRR